MTDLRSSQLIRQALLTDTASLKSSGLVRQALLTDTASLRVGGLARIVLMTNAASLKAAGLVRQVLISGTFAGSITESASAMDGVSATADVLASLTEISTALDTVNATTGFAVSISESTSATDIWDASVIHPAITAFVTARANQLSITGFKMTNRIEDLQISLRPISHGAAGASLVLPSLSDGPFSANISYLGSQGYMVTIRGSITIAVFSATVTVP